MPWVFISAALLPALIMAIIAGTVDRFVGSGTAEAVDLPSHSDYYSIASLILFLFAAAAAPELLCPDRRNGVINLYLVRPLTGSDYILARWLAFLSVMLLVAWLPQVVLLAGLAFGAEQPGDYLADNWEDIPKFLGSGAGIANLHNVTGHARRFIYDATCLRGRVPDRSICRQHACSVRNI